MRRLSSAVPLAAALLLIHTFAVQPPANAASHEPGGDPKAAVVAPPRGHDAYPSHEPTRRSGAGTASAAAQDDMSDPRVRPADSPARRLVADGARRSYTIARLIETIEQGNVVVYVHLEDPPNIPTSQTRLLFAAPNGWRYASVWVNQRLLPLQRLEMLGHELQHVVEIGQAPDVIDADSLQRLYERIGYASWHDRAFETKAATIVELQVNRELVATLGAEVAPQDDGAPQGAVVAMRRRLYDAYCTVCHGRDGRGRGPAAHDMSTPPPDLTVLARRQGGTFPWSQVEQCIRTTERSPASTVTDGMPVWTELPAPHGDAGAAAYAREITAYIESLQRRH